MKNCLAIAFLVCAVLFVLTAADPGSGPDQGGSAAASGGGGGGSGSGNAPPMGPPPMGSMPQGNGARGPPPRTGPGSQSAAPAGVQPR